MCYKQKCKVVSLNLAHPQYSELHRVVTDRTILRNLVSNFEIIEYSFAQKFRLKFLAVEKKWENFTEGNTAMFDD